MSLNQRQIDNLRTLYWINADIIDQIDRICIAVRRQNLHRLQELLPDLTRQLSHSIQLAMTEWKVLGDYGQLWDIEDLQSLLMQLEDAQKQRDMILLGDLLELQLSPSLIDEQNVIRNTEIPLIEPDWMEGNLRVLANRNPELYRRLREYNQSDQRTGGYTYALEPTNSGYYTMALEENGRRTYLHSNRNPMSEARMWAERIYRKESEQYLVIGMGLGYPVWALLQLDWNLDLVVVEADLELIWQALQIRDWRSMLDRITIIQDATWLHLHEWLSDERRLCIFRPELSYIREKGVRDKLEHLADKADALEDYELLFYQNTRGNIRNCDAYVDELREDIRGKKVVIVAGGPSLDKNVEQLKKKATDTRILAVGTVFPMLVERGIPVDYAIVSDAKVYAQFRDMEVQTIPVIVLATADRRIAEHYKGTKYLACQKGYAPAREYAESRNAICYDSGGSVATLALDVCIRLQAAAIAFAGLDLAYYGNKLHAAGTLQELFAGGGEQLVMGVEGEWLKSSRSFLNFKQWMERRIQEPDVQMPIIDATEGGAMKEGFQQMKLEEFLESNPKEQ